MLYRFLQFWYVIWLSQEDAADEIAEKIAQFLSKLPKSMRKIKEEPLPEHIQKMFDEAADTYHHHHHGHHHHHDHGSHDHAHTAGYMDAYGLGHGWAGWLHLYGHKPPPQMIVSRNMIFLIPGSAHFFHWYLIRHCENLRWYFTPDRRLSGELCVWTN